MTSQALYEVYAIKYATRDAKRADHFVGGDPHDAPMPMDYFVWVARSPSHTFVIDTGFTKPVAEARGRTHLRCPVESLKLIGVDPDNVEHVIQTHLHYDHVGNFDKFPKATFHLQEKEMQFATGRYVRYPKIGHSFEPDDICGMVRLNFKGRVEFYDGSEELADGLWIHPAPGHSAGLQFVRCRTRRGWVVVASDVAHYYEHIESLRPFTTLVHVGQMLDGYRRLSKMMEKGDHVVPGHDPEVMTRHPAPSADLEGIVVRLD